MLERRYIEAGGNIQDLQEMRSKVVYNDGSQCNENYNKNYPLVKGSFVEDESDPIYYYLSQTTTFTHFWKADDGDNQRNWVINSPNALMKAKNYIFAYEKNYTWFVKELYPFVTKEYIYTIPSSLIDFYNNGECIKRKVTTVFGIPFFDDPESIFSLITRELHTKL